MLNEGEEMKNNDIGKQLATLNHAIKKKVEGQMQGDLMKISMANGYILSFLHENRNRDVFQKDFEDAFGITRSTASKVCSLMETKGLIQRQPVSDDARLKKITLTDRGEAMRREMIEGRKRMEAKLTAGFSSEELQTLRDYLRRMKENMKR